MKGFATLGVKTSAVGFVDDVNILTYGRTTEANCKTLTEAQQTAEQWARTHGAAFAPAKYELMHLTRRPRKFNLGASIQIDGNEITPKTDTRVLGIQLHTKLQWGQYLKRVEAKNAIQSLALSRLGESTWGLSLPRARCILNTVVIPAAIYGAQVWHKRTKEGKCRGKERRLEVCQNRALRNITGAFKRVNVEVLKSEAYVPPIGMTLNRLQDRATLRSRGDKTAQVIRDACETMRAKLNVRGDGGRYQWSPKKQREETLQKVKEEGKVIIENERSSSNCARGSMNRGRDARETYTPAAETCIKRYHFRQREKLWESYRQRMGDAPRTPAQSTTLAKKMIEIRKGPAKAESSLATQIRTEKIGLKAFLYDCKVPGFEDPACSCGWVRQTAKHILMYCSSWKDQRTRMQNDAGTQDYRILTGTSRGLKAATRMLISTGLVGQFRLAKSLLYGEV